MQHTAGIILQPKMQQACSTCTAQLSMLRCTTVARSGSRFTAAGVPMSVLNCYLIVIEDVQDRMVR